MHAPSTGATFVNYLPPGDVPHLLEWLGNQLVTLCGPGGFWLAYGGRAWPMDQPPPIWLEHTPAHDWQWSLSNGQVLHLTLERTPTVGLTVMQPLLTLSVSLLEAHLEGCCQQLQQQRAMLDQIDSSVIAMDLNGYISSWNRGAERLFGYSKEEAIGQHVLFLYADEDDDDLLTETFLSGAGQEMLVRRKKRDGEIFWVTISLTLLMDEHGQPSGLLGYLQDATERVKSEEKLRLQAAIFEYSGEAIMVSDPQGIILSVNRAFQRLLNIAADRIVNQKENLLHSRQYDAAFWSQARTEALHKGHWLGEIRCTRSNGETFPAWLSLSSVHNSSGVLIYFVAILSDLSARKQAEAQIHQLAYFDSLTGLPNRAMLLLLVDQALEESRRSKSHGALLMIDIDRFKRINEALGVAAGDELLIKVAELLRRALRSKDVIARNGADEFIVALFDLRRREHAAIVAEKLEAQLIQPLNLGTFGELTITVSIGIVIFPDDGDSSALLLSNAGVALSRLRLQKTPEHKHMFFSPDMNQRVREHHALEIELRQAIEHQQLVPYYQPQFDVQQITMPAAEVLLRWQHPIRGMVSPGLFIPIAEETGLIEPIGDWVLENTCRTLKAWIDAGITPLRLSVNISARQFRPTLVTRIAGLLQQYQLPAPLLELEITESLLLSDIQAVAQLLHDLRALGVRVALDDFGTGYSALSYLRHLPIDALKIDRSFVMDLPGKPRDSSVVLAILRLAEHQELDVIAEGVETTAQLEFLRHHGCTVIQGFLLAKPMPKSELDALLLASQNPLLQHCVP